MSLETTKQMVDRRTLREKGIAGMVEAFAGFYAAELKRDDSEYNQYRLQLTTQFFDDQDLIKLMKPHFEGVSTNVEEKRAAARAALWSVMIRRSFGVHQDGIVQQLFTNDNAADARLKVLEKTVRTHTLEKETK